MIKQAFFGGIFIGVTLGVTLAQTPQQPASIVTTPTTSPEGLQVRDKTGAWVPMGTLNSNHSFRAVAGVNTTQIVVTDPTIGMASGGQDNSPFVQTLMNHIVNPNNIYVTGYDVVFPGIAGQAQTEYYFTQPLDLAQGANYRCSGTTYHPATALIFAPGINGVIFDYNSSGAFNNCTILTMGTGNAIANPITPTVLTNVVFHGDPAGVISSPTWHVGDAIIMAPSKGGFYPTQAILPVPMGTTVTNVDGPTGNLTISNPVSPLMGPTANIGFGTVTHSTAVFTETGSNNFAHGDTITVGSTTYTLVLTFCLMQKIMF